MPKVLQISLDIGLSPEHPKYLAGKVLEFQDFDVGSSGWCVSRVEEQFPRVLSRTCPAKVLHERHESVSLLAGAN